MASTREILDKELENPDYIHLYSEGIFWKAYQQSAYRMILKAGKLKPLKKYIKTVDCEVISVGFPDSTLHKYFSEEEIERTADGKLIRIPCTEPDVQEYEKWFSSVAVSEAKKTETAAQSETIGEIERTVLRKIKEYNVEASTPMQSMIFLASIRKELFSNGYL